MASLFRDKTSASSWIFHRLLTLNLSRMEPCTFLSNPDLLPRLHSPVHELKSVICDLTHFPSQQSVKPVGSISLVVLFHPHCQSLSYSYYYCPYSRGLNPPACPVKLESIVPKSQQPPCFHLIVQWLLHIKSILISKLLRLSVTLIYLIFSLIDHESHLYPV